MVVIKPPVMAAKERGMRNLDLNEAVTEIAQNAELVLR
jgi:hypothetical protein